MLSEITAEAKIIIDAYSRLHIRHAIVQTPYYINVQRVRGGLRSLVGKGTPEEIVDEVKIFAQLRGFKLQDQTPANIKRFMESQGIGIDCSGYVSQILDHVLRKKTGKGIYFHIKFKHPHFYSWLVNFIRPIEHIGADLLTSLVNSTKINYQDIAPGDLVRLKGLKAGDHILLIIATDRSDTTQELRTITYTHSSSNYGDDNGVRTGQIVITDLNKPLEKQHWTEIDETGESPTLQQYLTQLEDNGIFRPKFFDKLA